MSVSTVELRQNGEGRLPHHFQQDIERPPAAALAVEQLVFAEHQGTDAIKHPAQLEVGKRALHRLCQMEAVFQQQNVPPRYGRHIG
ncbi:hypothetical protein D3C79_704150 [compost metagenome]